MPINAHAGRSARRSGPRRPWPPPPGHGLLHPATARHAPRHAEPGLAQDLAQPGDEGAGIVGANGDAAPEAARISGTSVPGSMAATTGRPAARIEYVFDGTLTAPSPARSGTTWTSPVARTSFNRSLGW